MFEALYMYISDHSMSPSCRTSTKEIWAAFFRQTFLAKLQWFWAASSTATVQVNAEKVKPDILLLIFSSWNRLYQGRGVVPYHFSLLASKPSSTEIKTHNMDCNRPFLKHLAQLINCPLVAKKYKNMIFHSKIHYIV